MIEVIGVIFNDKGRIYYFSPENFDLKKNTKVIVETEKGQQYGKVATDLITVEQKQLKNAVKKVIRIATDKDLEKHIKNKNDAEEALKKCREITNKLKLNMNIIEASYTFDRNQLIFKFLSDSRVDFRELAKELAYLYHTRIELRQVGVRDKAKEVGGFGSCGKEFCCSQFLNDFDTVSINMAKNQNLALNPSKINGSCGRLLCCLKYENDNYTEYRKDLPTINKKVKVNNKEGKVVSLDILNKSYRVNLPDEGIVEVKL